MQSILHSKHLKGYCHRLFSPPQFESLSICKFVKSRQRNQIPVRGGERGIFPLLKLFFAAMAFISFLGRLLFVSVFVLSAYQEFNEFGVDGGPAAKSLKPKFDVFSKHVKTQSGLQFPHVDMKHLILGAIIMKSLGSLLFVFDSTFGALILLLQQAITTPILFDFYNYEADKKEFHDLFVKFTQGLALLGALLFFIGMKNSLPRRSPKKKTTKAKTN